MSYSLVEALWTTPRNAFCETASPDPPQEASYSDANIQIAISNNVNREEAS